MGGALYVCLGRAVKMLAPFTRAEVLELMKGQGVWPTAVRNLAGDSPETNPRKGVQWWVEFWEVRNLQNLFISRRGKESK